MTQTTTNPEQKIAITVTEWIPIDVAVEQFIEAHPELGLLCTPNTKKNFRRLYGKKLMALDVMRRPGGIRRPSIVHRDRFDAAAYELITKGITQ
jgi:hypothetical protein